MHFVTITINSSSNTAAADAIADTGIYKKCLDWG